MSDVDFNREMLKARESLRAFAISLCGNVDRAEDLVQETFLRAIANAGSFQLGTNMSAWLFTILRNHFRSEYRKRRREVEDSEGHYAETLKTMPEQYGQIEYREFREALKKLPRDQREALVLVGASGFSYEETGRICGCAVGTVKSRVNRARTRLAGMLHINGPIIEPRDENIGPLMPVNFGRDLGPRHRYVNGHTVANAQAKMSEHQAPPQGLRLMLGDSVLFFNRLHRTRGKTAYVYVTP